MPSKQLLPIVFARNASAFAVLACASFVGARAQQAAPMQSGPSDPSIFASASPRTMDLATFAGVGYSSSSSDTDSALPADPSSLNLSGAGLQPPPRRRYGSPRYSDHMHNADGTNKYVFEVGVGATLPIGNTFKYYNTSWAVGGGGGRQFNKHFSVLLKFDYDHFGLGKSTLDNQAILYNTDFGAGIDGLDGNAHVWSFTLNPVYNFYAGDKYGAYITGGVGFYHKVTDFTAPETGEYCDPYYGCYQYEANANIDSYTSNAPGYSGGLGLTYKFSRFADEKFFIEARYVFVQNSPRVGLTAANYGALGGTYTGTDYFPANSNRTAYVPIKVGIRF